MNYTVKEGIVLTKICGEWFLIPTREASETSPHILRLQLPSVFVWQMLKKGKSRNEMLNVLGILLHKQEREAEGVLDTILSSFIARNMLVKKSVPPR